MGLYAITILLIALHVYIVKKWNIDVVVQLILVFGYTITGMLAIDQHWPEYSQWYTGVIAIYFFIGLLVWAQVFNRQHSEYISKAFLMSENAAEGKPYEIVKFGKQQHNALAAWPWYIKGLFKKGDNK